MNINYIVGDATNPQGPGNKIIAHCCNDIGGWGRGFVVALSKKWKEPEECYRKWYKTGEPNFGLGEVQFVKVEENLQIANIIGQHGVAFEEGPPIRYEAIRAGMLKLKEKAEQEAASIHIPRIGCKLAGGNWNEIFNILKEVFGDSPYIQINVYTMPDEVDDYENLTTD